MKKIIPFLILCLIATCNAELRTWTAINGKKVDAEFVSNEKGVVKLKLKSGKVFEVTTDKLSKEDNEFISSLAKPEGVNNGKKVVDKVRYEPEIRFEGLPSLVYAKGSNKPYTGKMIGYLDEKKIMERNFKDGMVSGLTTRWHENGKKKSEVNYEEDLIHGLMITWYENGQMASETNYDRTLEHGPSKEWHENGQKKSEITNWNGLISSWKKWNSEGKLIDEGDNSLEEAFK